MNTKVKQALLSGIAGTAVMTMIILMGPLMGLPKMNPAVMLSAMMGNHIIAGYVMHFMIGIIFAAAYVFIIAGWLHKIDNKILKGALFGFGVFIFAQIAMAMMSAVMGGMPMPQGKMSLIMLGSIIGHVVYGIVVALVAKNALEYSTS